MKKPINGILNGTKIIVKDKEILKYIKEDFEEEKENKNVIEISLIEGLYLVEKKLLNVYDKKKLEFFEIVKKATEITNDEKFYIKFLVYKDLRAKGYYVFSGYKFGADFRVYERDQKAQEGQKVHAKFLVNVFPEERLFSFVNLSGDVRMTKGVNKSLIYAVVNADNEIIYYGIERMTL